MVLILIYETRKLESDLYRIVGMRARAIQDYLHQVSNQSRALGLSVTDYMIFHEDSPSNPKILKKMKDFPNLDRFGISIYNGSKRDVAFAGTLTAVGSTQKVNSSLLKELEAVLSLGGQFETLVEKQPEVVWAYYLSKQQFLYFTPNTGKAANFQFTDELYTRPFWLQAEPKANPDGLQIITELYEDINEKGLMITIAEPVYYRGQFMGVASLDIGLDMMKRILETGDGIGESMLIDEHRHVIATTGKDDFRALQKIQIPEIPLSQPLFRKDLTYWASFEVKPGEVYLIHKIEVFDFVLYIIRGLLPIWGLVCALAVVLILYLQLRSSIEQIATLIHTDPLTGISNRRGFLKLTQRSLAISSRHGQTWTILMLDIDHFKSVNDQYGHEEGDRILVKVAQILSSCVRQTDAVCRWGGEEFAIFLFGANPEDSMNIAEHLREEVEQKVLLQNGNSVTVSIGISEGRGGKHGLEESFSHADQALYRAKTTGRNRVCAFDPIRSF
ncbi:diguanylate cyclase [Leptospira sp. 201903070]|uniref:diguanylate cyclase n=1 Tax=Leptospira ainlahdjerensis TaxID=2810033 RepID=A0ABS2UCQ2_9LEPT|nr:sensor domain-containing diguanylate cyclase [Leptospira ainlahdjerensis]MBM9578152.1 diguanylate cyclase [Leptospira ainlahdjerensis]